MSPQVAISAYIGGTSQGYSRDSRLSTFRAVQEFGAAHSYMREVRLLVTGGAGYLGRVFCTAATAAGHNISIIDTCLYASDGGAELFRRYSGRRADLREIDKNDLHGIEAVVHLAAISNDPTADFQPAQTQAVNIAGTEILLDRMQAVGVARLIFASTASIYDGGISGNEIADEQTAVHPSGIYSVTKLIAEDRIRACSETIGSTIFRFGTLYGMSERMRFDLVVNAFVRAAIDSQVLTVFGDGTNRRPILDVHDAAMAILHALISLEPQGSEIYTVVGENISIGALADRVINVSAGKSNRRPAVRFAPAPERSRDYAASAAKWLNRAGTPPLRDSAIVIAEMYEELRSWPHERLFDARGENIAWLRKMC